MQRLLGYMAYKTVDTKSNISSHEKLVGTQDALVAENPETVRKSDFCKNVQNPTSSVVRPENISSIFWSQIQLGVLQSKRTHVILTGDYGVGKTFLLKVIIQHLSIQLS